MFRFRHLVLAQLMFMPVLLPLKAQKTNNAKPPGQEEIAKRFPKEDLISMQEEVRIVFTARKENSKSKTTRFLVEQNYKASFFTPEPEYKKITSVFYDDFSRIKNVICKENGRAKAQVPLVNTNYQSAGIFHDDVKVCLFPLDMVKGSSYEISYTKEFDSPRHLEKLYFNTGFPLLKKRIVIEVPAWVDLEVKEVNFSGYKINKTEVPNALKKTKEIVYELENVLHIKEESHSPNWAKFLPHLLLFVKSYTLPGQSPETVFKTHDDVYAWCKKLTDESNLVETAALKAAAKEIAGTETDSLKIMTKVFYWVQEHVRYIAFEDGIMGYKPMTADNVYNKLYGDCKGMANLTKVLLRNLGFDARITWIGTNDIPYSNDLPSLCVYNHMICTVFLGGKKYFLDATEDFIALDDYAERIQGRPVMIEDGNKYITEVIPTFTYERNKKDYQTELNVDKNGNLEGKCSYTFNGEGKTSFLRQVAGIKSDNRMNAIKNYLKDANPNVLVSNVKTSDLLARSGPLTLSCDIVQQNSCYTTSANEMLLMPEREFDFDRFEFDSTRVTDYEFDGKYFMNYTTKINLPGGVSVNSLPTAVNVKNDNYEFLFNYVFEGGALLIRKSIIIKNTLLEKKFFDQWNKDIKLLKIFYREPAIIKLK